MCPWITLVQVRTSVASFVRTEYYSANFTRFFLRRTAYVITVRLWNNTLPFSLRFSGSVKTQRCMQRKRNGNFYLRATVYVHAYCTVQHFVVRPETMTDCGEG